MTKTYRLHTSSMSDTSLIILLIELMRAGADFRLSHTRKPLSDNSAIFERYIIVGGVSDGLINRIGERSGIPVTVESESP